jgi:PAS domain S-box-containing protein
MRYGFALAALALALCARWLLSPILGPEIAAAGIILAIFASAWYGGFGPAAVVILLGPVSMGLLFPDDSDGGGGIVGAILYFVITTGIALLSAGMSSAQRRAIAVAEELQTTLHSIGDAVLVTDRAGRVKSLNPVAEQLTGWQSEAARGQPLEAVFVVVHEKTRETVENPAARALREGIIVGLANHSVLISKQGVETAIDDSAAPIRGPDDTIIGVVLVFRDVSQQRRAADELRNLYQALREADRRKDEFLAMLAHELRNPLAPIRSGLDILSLEGGDKNEHIALMQEQVGHLVRLVDDLLDVSRIVRGKVELRLASVPVEVAVHRALDIVRPAAESRGQQLHVQLPDSPLFVNADPVRLVQILENLLNNASKYTDHGGRIELTVARDGESVVIAVRDNGMGIEPEFLPRVFELFTQASRSLDRAQGGMGIGLTLVHELVEMHGGSISAASEGRGHGSVFTVRLPLAEPEEAAAPAPLAGDAAQTPRRVLVVDDNVSAASMLTQLIGRLGPYDVQAAHNGSEALRLTKELRPDLVLLDIGLPGMDGYDVARAIRADADSNGLLLVAVTGYGQDDDRRLSREAGFDEHLVKPVPVADILRLFQHPKLSQVES